MTYFALFVLLAWAPLCLVFFLMLPARRAAVLGTIGGWLLIPPVQIDFSGFPPYGKTLAVSVGVLLGTVFFDLSRFTSFRVRWFDLPMILWCFCPSVSSLSNGFGGLEPISTFLSQVCWWLLPYLIGRLYFSDTEGLRELTMGIIVGAVCLIPGCILENRMSPILLPMVYGVSTFFIYSGSGTYRPRVFFATGLELGLWMNVAALAAFWLLRTKQLKSLWVFSGRTIFVALFITAGLCRTTGASILLLTSMGTLWICQRTKTKWALWCFLLVTPIYFGLRIPNLWTGDNLVELIRVTISEERAGSLGYRMHFENVFIGRALERPMFGWDGWGRNLVADETGFRPGIDALWVITFGCYGSVGLLLMTSAMLLPVLLFLVRFKAAEWASPSVAPAAALAVVVNMFMIDCLFNAMPNSIYVVAMGALTGMVVPARQLRAEITTSSESTSQESLVVRCRTAGRAAKDQGRLADAKTAWLSVLDLLTEPKADRTGDPVIQKQWCDCANDLAWLLVNTLDPKVRDIPQGVSLAVKATKLQPECSTYWNTLGAAYYRAGDFKRAIDALDRAENLGNGGNVFDHVFLAAAHAQLGNQEQSRHWLALANLEQEKWPAGHSELTRLMGEAQSIVAAGPGAPAIAPPS